MKLDVIRSSNPAITAWKFADTFSGLEVFIVECEDKSGFVARIVDAFSGELVKNLIGSSVENVANKANDYIGKITLSGVLESAFAS